MSQAPIASTITVTVERNYRSASHRTIVRYEALDGQMERGWARAGAVEHATLMAARKLGYRTHFGRRWDGVSVDSGAPCRIQLLCWDARSNGSHCSDVLIRDVEIEHRYPRSRAERAAAEVARADRAMLDRQIQAEREADYERSSAASSAA